MTPDEYKRWLEVTASSEHKWVEDEIFRLNGRGTFYFIGGEDGVYIKATTDGILEFGYYDGAVPHIGEAMFKPVESTQHDSFNDAYTDLCQRGGIQFLIDMMSQDSFSEQPYMHEQEM